MKATVVGVFSLLCLLNAAQGKAMDECDNIAHSDSDSDGPPDVDWDSLELEGPKLSSQPAAEQPAAEPAAELAAETLDQVDNCAPMDMDDFSDEDCGLDDCGNGYASFCDLQEYEFQLITNIPNSRLRGPGSLRYMRDYMAQHMQGYLPLGQEEQEQEQEQEQDQARLNNELGKFKKQLEAHNTFAESMEQWKETLKTHSQRFSTISGELKSLMISSDGSPATKRFRGSAAASIGSSALFICCMAIVLLRSCLLRHKVNRSRKDGL